MPERFLASKGTLRLDAIMTWLIRISGVSIIVMVLGIFVFVLGQILPLFKGAQVGPESVTPVVADAAKVKAFGVDESSRLPFVYEGGDELRFIDLSQNGRVIPEKLNLPAGAEISSVDYHAANHRLAFGTSQGQVGLIDISFATEGTGAGARVRGSAKTSAIFDIGEGGGSVELIGYGDNGSEKLFAAVQNQNGAWKLVVFPLVQKKSLMGAGKIEKGAEIDLTAQIARKPVKLLVPQTADSLLVADESGAVSYFFFNDGQVEKRQEFSPMAGTASPVVASMDFIFGDVSIVFTNAAGDTRMFSLSHFRGGRQTDIRADENFSGVARRRHVLCRERAQQVFPDWKRNPRGPAPCDDGVDAMGEHAFLRAGRGRGGRKIQTPAVPRQRWKNSRARFEGSAS